MRDKARKSRDGASNNANAWAEIFLVSGFVAEFLNPVMKGGLIWLNNRVPAAMPMSDAGMSRRSSDQIHFPRWAHNVTRSITQRIGNRIAAAWSGEMTSAINGTATIPKPPAKPPFAIP